MTPAVAKLSEEAIILFCLLFAPAGEKEILIDVVGAHGPGDNLVAIRTDTGFEVSEVWGEGDQNKRKVVTITRVKDRPFVFELKDRRNRDTLVDLSKCGKAIKPLKEAPKQRFKVKDAIANITARGRIVYVNFRGMPVTFVVHCSGKAVRPKPSATTQPSTTTAPAETPPSALTQYKDCGFLCRN